MLAGGVPLDDPGHATSSTPDDAGAVRADPARTNAKNTVLALGAKSHHVCSYSDRPSEILTFFTQDSGLN